MRSPEPWVLAAALLFGSAGATAQAGTQAAAPKAAPPAMSASAVMAAASAVEADPLMPGIEKSKSLRLKRDDSPPPDPNMLKWWTDLVSNMSAALRVVMWLAVAALFIWVLLRLRNWLGREAGAGALPALAPTHVGTLDIRPESLPADIGAAAQALLERGQDRAALSLLYRGALSRLVHGHGVPIRAASTERECLTLAAPRLAPARQAFLAELVSAWQMVAYAGRTWPREALAPLCSAFEAQLPASAEHGS